MSHHQLRRGGPLVDHLGDALGLGLDLRDLFIGDFTALWLGDAAGAAVDFVVRGNQSRSDVDLLQCCAEVAAAVDDQVTRAVLWRSVDDLTDLPALAADYFERRDELGERGIHLVDEIAVSTDELRSMAVTTMSDDPGWDDITHLFDVCPDCD